MKKLIALLITLPPLLFAALFGYILYKGPRMTVQHHFREFQLIAPPTAAGTVSVTPAVVSLAASQPPLQATPDNLVRGRVYYHYYCVFCHGDDGDGDGPVGQSFHPKPADLRTGKVSGYGDGQLLRAMLTGAGHQPVLERVVPAEHRRYLALFVRSLGTAPPSTLPP